MKTITVCNQKGGTGKTTTVMAFAYGLAAKGYKVLCVDLDQQGSLTKGFGFLDKKITNIYNFAIEGEDARLHKDGIDLIAATSEGVFAFMETIKKDILAPSNYIKKAIAPIKHEYDFIIIDTPPMLDLQLTNALVASDYVVIPVETSFFSASGFKEVADTIKMVQAVNPNLKISGAFINKYTSNISTYEEYADVINEMAQRLGIPVFKTKVRNSSKITKNQSDHVDLYKQKSKNPAAQDFEKLVEDFLKEAE